jgi:uncharacterized protein YceK
MECFCLAFAAVIVVSGAVSVYSLVAPRPRCQPQADEKSSTDASSHSQNGITGARLEV